MGLLDFLKGKPAQKDAPAPTDKVVARFAKTAADKYAQNYDRLEAIEALAKVGSAESAAALLKRFVFHIDPSITDHEEKEAAERGVVAAGEAAVEPIRAFCARAESLTWPLRILKQVVSDERYVDEILALLEVYDTDYTRNSDPKQQLVGELEGRVSDAARLAAERFLDDASDEVRFAALTVVFAQGSPLSVAPVSKQLANEESVRIKTRIAEGLASAKWQVPEELRAGAARALPPGFVLGGDGSVARR